MSLRILLSLGLLVTCCSTLQAQQVIKQKSKADLQKAGAPPGPLHGGRPFMRSPFSAP